MFSRLVFLVALVDFVSATVIQAPDVTPLSPDQVTSYAPYTHYSGAVFCDQSQILTWSCGVHCEATPNFQIYDYGGDGVMIPYWLVGFDPDQGTAIVAHEGTNISRILSILTDLKVTRTGLDSTLFPGVPSSVRVHSGFAQDQAQTATQILSAVQGVVGTFGTSTVTTVGHSLGAALSLLDCIYLRLQLPADISVRAILYGLPRVGNQDFANFVDTLMPGQVTHVNNKQDPVPILPGRFLGYHHPSGEIHIDASNKWEVCPGQDNPFQLCIVGAVPILLFGNPRDHNGPYDGISMPCNPSSSDT